MRPKVVTVERKLARLAARSHGVVTRGVYRVGHRAPSLEARYLSAVRACGEGAVLCGRAAAYLWGLVRGPAPDPEVTAPGGRRVKGVITRRCRQMDPSQRTVWRAIPITTPAKTLVDLAAAVDETELARACHQGKLERLREAGLPLPQTNRPAGSRRVDCR